MRKFRSNPFTLSKLSATLLILCFIYSASHAQESIQIKNAQGNDISASLFEGGKTTVILSNQNGKYKGSWTKTARLLQARGATVLTFNYRSRPRDLHHDILTMVEFAKERGAKQIFLMGASRGGSAALKAATLVNIAGVIALSPHEHPTSSGGSAPTIQEVARIRSQTLLIVSKNDYPYFSSTVRIDKAARNSTLIAYKGRSHGIDLVGKSEVQQQFLGFMGL